MTFFPSTCLSQFENCELREWTGFNHYTLSGFSLSTELKSKHSTSVDWPSIWYSTVGGNSHCVTWTPTKCTNHHRFYPYSASHGCALIKHLTWLEESSPPLCCWSQGSQSWCWRCVRSGSRGGVWRGWAWLSPVRCPAPLASKPPTGWTSPSPRFPRRRPAGPGTKSRPETLYESQVWGHHSQQNTPDNPRE